MKYFLSIIALTMIISSCRQPSNENEERLNYKHIYTPECKLIDITFNDETHEYIRYVDGYAGSLSHWEGCKYCKETKDSL